MMTEAEGSEAADGMLCLEVGNLSLKGNIVEQRI